MERYQGSFPTVDDFFVPNSGWGKKTFLYRSRRLTQGDEHHNILPYLDRKFTTNSSMFTKVVTIVRRYEFSYDPLTH
jgi:hypothetical protein